MTAKKVTKKRQKKATYNNEDKDSDDVYDFVCVCVRCCTFEISKHKCAEDERRGEMTTWGV